MGYMHSRRTKAPPQEGDAIVARALDILAARLREPGAAMNSPQHVKDYLKLELGSEDREFFVVLFLDHAHRVVSIERMFAGTLSQTAVYPREVARRALLHNASAVVVSHNHPSGVAEPSAADEHLTRQLRETLALVDVRVLDHIVVAGITTSSFAERGLL